MSDQAFWIKQLKRADKKEESWREEAKRVEKRYADDRKANDETYRFNLLWSNVETQRPQLYSSTPKPDVRRRFYGDDLPDADPVGKDAAKLIERGISYAVDPGNGVSFDSIASQCVTDFLVPGRTIARVKYVPTFATSKKRIDLNEEEDGTLYHGLERVETEGKTIERDETGPFYQEDYEEVVWEEVKVDRVPYKLYRVEPACSWGEVTWQAFGHLYSKTECEERWGKEYDIPMNYNAEGESADKGDYALVWEIEYKTNRKIYWVCEGCEKVLEEEDDRLHLEGFFSTPEPAYALPRSDTLVPKPEYALYEDQAQEIDLITARISSIITMVKATGLYAGEGKDFFEQLKTAADGDLIAVEDWRGIMDKGGVKGFIEWWPIKDVVDVFQVLVRERADLIAQIYELTGIADIQRGATDPRETKGAQVLKANYATRRLLPKQQTMQRFFRDLYRLMAEVMVEHFDPKRLQEMTGVQITPPLLMMLKTDGLRNFRIDIETDSTIAPDDAREKEGIAEFITALSRVGQSFAPLVQANPGSAPMVGKIVLWAMRRFRVSRDIEGELVAALNAPPPAPKPDPEMVKAQTEMQVKKAELEMDGQRMQMELQKMMIEMQLEQRKFQQEMQMKMAEFQQDLQLSKMQSAVDMENSMRESAAKADATRNQSLNQQRANA